MVETTGFQPLDEDNNEAVSPGQEREKDPVATSPQRSDSDRQRAPWIHHSKSTERESRRKSFAFKKFPEGGESDWWFASTAIPLLAATLGPLANVLSIAALVTYWRMNIEAQKDGKIDGTVPELQGKPFPDPRWIYWLNVASLILGFVGNLFLLMNFTQRIRYIIALPATIILWYAATGILAAIIICMHNYLPPKPPYETYTQGFWYAVAAVCIYFASSMLLMINMLGYFMGHYPETFELNDHQRTLILQTMMFFIWLAGGAGIFSNVEASWSFTDALYFCDVTILTVGFGDLAPSTDVGRGLVFPYSVGGIITLGLVIGSIHKFVQELGQDKIVKQHFEKRRQKTVDRMVSDSKELERKQAELANARGKSISGPMNPVNQSTASQINDESRLAQVTSISFISDNLIPRRRKPKKSKLLLLREEKDRFDAMRGIQHDTGRFKRWWALTMSVIAFGILWCVGAVVFWQCEKITQGMTYFQALYFCYVSLLTIGYGDLAPKSNAGRCFFVVWSLIAVPTMTVLVSDMGDTIIDNFKKATSKLADFTVLPKYGIWRDILEKWPWLLKKIQSWLANRAQKRRMKKGMPVGPDNDNDEEAQRSIVPSLSDLAREAEETETGHAPSEHEMAKRLAAALREVSDDVRRTPKKRYNYEEWAEYTQLIRFSSKDTEKDAEEDDEEGLLNWDWVGENSPMISGVSEPEFLLDRLCESLNRYIRRQAEQATFSQSQMVYKEVSEPSSSSSKEIREPSSSSSKNSHQQ